VTGRRPLGDLPSSTDTPRVARILAIFGWLAMVVGVLAGIVLAFTEMPAAPLLTVLSILAGLFAGLGLIGFAANLRILHTIHRTLAEIRDRPSSWR